MDLYEKYLKMGRKELTLLRKILKLEKKDIMSKFINLNEQYKASYNRNDMLLEQIQEMKKNETVIEYYRLIDKYHYLQTQIDYLYEQIILQKYRECDHFLIIVDGNDENNETNKKYRCCIKCGLDERILIPNNRYGGVLTKEQKMMAFYMEHYYYDSAYYSDINCDFEFAKDTYKKIIENNPEIDNITLEQYLNNKIDYIKLYNDRKQGRIQRYYQSKKI